MSIGALELASLFRKYTGTLADIDLQEAQNTRLYNQTTRDLRDSKKENVRKTTNNMATQGLTHSGTNLKAKVDLNKAYEKAGADASAQNKANLSTLAKKRLDAKGDYDEGVALSKMSSILQKQGV